MGYNICEDNILCCDNHCQKCAKSIYNKYMEQKAEIKRLENAYKQCAWERDIFAEDYREEIRKDISILQVDINKVKSETRKEFAEELKTRIKNALFCFYNIRFKNQQELLRIIVAKIDNLLKEMEQEE